MPDITMCKGTGCPKREQCYRAQATPSNRQSYFIVPPYNKKKQDCAYLYQFRRDIK